MIAQSIGGFMRQSAMFETLFSFFRFAVDSFFSRASLGRRLTYSVTSGAAGRYRFEIVASQAISNPYDFAPQNRIEVGRGGGI
jgi:hypothetical protein